MGATNALRSAVPVRHRYGRPQDDRLTVSVEPYPYPYRAMMAICSDLDLTPDRDVYVESSRFLNTTQDTAMGPGVGLEVGNTMYFAMAPGQFSYWTATEREREDIHTLMRSGHIDCIHSYGDRATSRGDAERALEALRDNDCHLQVWVDHSKAPTNFGPDIMAGSGDVVGAAAYHADLTLHYGIRYVWRGRTTGIIGQDAPVNLSALTSLFAPRHPVASARTLVKEAVKVHLGQNGHERWKMYGANQICRASALRDGRPIWEFLRSNSYWGGSGLGDRPERLADVLTTRMIDTLVRREGTCILYVHLGKVSDRRRPFNEETCGAFRRLGAARDAGMVLVATTQRMLRYLTVRNCLRYRVRAEGEGVCISIDHVADPVRGAYQPAPIDVQGITFCVPRNEDVRIELSDGRRLRCDFVHRSGRTYACIPWRGLEFPDIK